MKASDAIYKERQLRKRDSRMIRLMYENPSPTNRPPIPHAPSDEEESEPVSGTALGVPFNNREIPT
jgi:hypothetical protein